MEQRHFLLVTFPAQGHINPARHLARRLARTTGARVTLSTTVAAHRRMFPSSASATEDKHGPEEQEDGLVTYAPYSDGYDDGFNPETQSTELYMSRSKTVGSESLSRLARALAARGRPVTCVIYTILLSWAVGVADDLGIPSVLFWIQPAAVFTLYHRYFHGYAGLFSPNMDDVQIPGLPSLQMRDLPSFLTVTSTSTDFYVSVLACFKDLFQTLARPTAGLSVKGSKPVVLVNSFDALETEALSAVDELELTAIGPTVGGDRNEVAKGGGDLFEQDDKRYMEWLDTKAKGSVVYVSFGSFSVLSKKQREEISRGLMESGRPYLWVVRQDNRGGEGNEVGLEGRGEAGIVVEWCSQGSVLSHSSVGCFVTHCGWNSTLEGIVCGVPMVMVPQWSEQPTNARLAEGQWGIGVRAEVKSDGVLEGSELRRCLDIVMKTEEKRGVEIRRRAAMWKEMALEAITEGGSSDRNLRKFVEQFGELPPKSKAGNGAG